MTRSLAAAVALAAVLPLAALELGPERPVSGVTYELAPETRLHPRVAASEEGALVVWADYRGGPAALWSARLDREGRLLDPVGRKLADDGQPLDVVWTGSSWLVTYLDSALIKAITVSRDGVPAAPLTVLDTGRSIPATVRMATTGRSVALVTNLGTGRILDTEGRVLKAFSFAPGPKYHDSAIGVAALGDGYGIALVGAAGVEFRRLSAAGEVSAPRLLPGSEKALTTAIGSDGSSFLVVYDEPPSLYAQQLDAAGAPAGERRQAVTLEAAPGPLYPSIEWGGSDYLVSMMRLVEEQYAEPMAMHLTREGGLAAPAAVVPIGMSSSSRVDIARRTDGSGVLVAVSGRNVLEGAMLEGGSPRPRTIRELSFSAPSQRDVRVAAEGSTLVTAWVETTGTRSDVLAAYGVGAPPVLIARDDHVGLVDLVVDDDVVWVLWSAGGGARLMTRRYTRALEPMDRLPVMVLPGAGAVRFQAAAGGGALCVTWAGDMREPGVFNRIVAPRQGRLAVTTVDLAVENNAALADVAWNGSEFVVVWSNALASQWWQLPKPAPHNLLAVRIGTDGSRRDTVPLVVSDAPNVLHRALAVAPGDGSVVVAWQSVPAPYSRSLPKVTSIARFDGRERPPSRVLDPGSDRGLVNVAADGDRIAVLWSSARLEFAMLRPDLTVEESGSFAVSVSSADIALRRASPAIAYSRPMDEPELGGVHRVFLRATQTGRRRAAR